MLKIAQYLYRKTLTTLRIRALEIEQAGVDQEGDPYIKITNGLTFFGPKPPRKEKKFYAFFLSKKFKRILPFECYQVAIDIVIRYNERNLKWGGPAKEANYTVKKGDIVAEMGAFRGYYTLYLSRQVGPEGTIVAIEPIPDNVRFLKKNSVANGLNNVIVVPKGVWNKNGEKIFQRKATDYQSGSIDIAYTDSDSEAIEVNTLDTILRDNEIKNVDFMLIQLNGAEIEALDGLEKYLPKHIAIAARYNKQNRDIARECASLLRQRRYQVQTVDSKFVYAQLA